MSSGSCCLVEEAELPPSVLGVGSREFILCWSSERLYVLYQFCCKGTLEWLLLSQLCCDAEAGLAAHVV
jgi:hypothetical protein